MRVKLAVVVGPHHGQEFNFDGHEVFLAGRSPRCHFQVDDRDKAFSRVHFLIEFNPPQCRLVDLGNRNGTLVNGKKVGQTDLRNGDQIQVGQTTLRLTYLSEPTIGVAATTDEPLSGVLFRAPLSESKSAGENLPPGIPRQIGNYRILRPLGHGIAGTTCAGIRQTDNATVAIKVIDPPLTGSRDILDRLLNELSGLHDLEEKRVLRIQECAESGKLIFLVTPLVNAVDAGKFFKQIGQLPFELAIGMMRPALRALEKCHAEGATHGAIKPTNILIEEKETTARVNLSDFGVTRTYESSPLSGLTLSGNIGDAVHYLAPERLRNWRSFTPACDQYSVAATLYFLLTGFHVYDQDTQARSLARIINEEPVSIRQRRPDIPDEVASVVHRSLARDPRDRFASISDMREALDRFL
jgi:serine/threonine-protein kinase